MKLEAFASLVIIIVLYLVKAVVCATMPANRTSLLQVPKWAGRRVQGPVYAWSSWGPWSPCSRTCGGGVSVQERHCLPSKTGRRRRKLNKSVRARRVRDTPDSSRCPGLAQRYHECNTTPCPGPMVDSREEQCSAYDKRPFRGHFYTWVPYIDGNAPCVLNCRPRGQQFYASLSLAADGTPCTRPHYRAICLQGLCKVVGRDNVLASASARELQCGSRLVSGLFTKSQLPLGYTHIATVPTGACRLNVTEAVPSENYIAVKVNNGSYIINGGFALSAPGVYEAAGTRFDYRRSFGSDIVLAKGPITQPIDIMILYQRPETNIKYEYYVHGAKDTRVGNDVRASGSDVDRIRHQRRHRGKYAWRIDWAACSRSCGGGFAIGTWKCQDETGVLASAHLCPGALPTARKRRCGQDPCAPRWRTAPWGSCPACGPATRTRLVGCVQDHARGITKVSDSLCLAPRPPTSEDCPIPVCDPDSNRAEVQDAQVPQVARDERASSADEEVPLGWLVTDWSQCVGSCIGGGVRSRQVKCIDPGICDTDKPPAEYEACPLPDACKTHRAQWMTGEWGGCAGTPGCGGRQSRAVLCVGGGRRAGGACPGPRPLSSRPCPAPATPACPSAWYLGAWGKCKGSCRLARQHRIVKCLSPGGEDQQCGDKRPHSSRPCSPDYCTASFADAPLAHHAPLTTTTTAAPDIPRVTRNELPPRLLPDHKTSDNEICPDKLSNCALAVQARLCHYNYYIENCCHSCHGR